MDKDSFDYQEYQDQVDGGQISQDLLDRLSRENQSNSDPFGIEITPKMNQKILSQHSIDSLEIEKEQGKLNFGDENPSQSYSQHSSTHAETRQNLNLPSNLSPAQKEPCPAEIGQKKKDKKDQIRNLYPNAMKTVVKKILLESELYDAKLQKISRKMEQDFGYLSIKQFKEYCSSLKVLDFSLREIYSLMNYNEGTFEQKQKKKMLREFFCWFMEKRYTIQIIKSEQCEFKETYIRGKNILRYLPAIKSKKEKASVKNTLSQKL